MLDPTLKLVHVLTLENIADAALRAGLTTTAELQTLVAELRAAVDDLAMLLAGPRIVQAWARKPQ